MAPSTREDGRRLRELRVWRRQSLRVVAELAGISEGHLSHLERGTRPLDRRSLVLALADALRVSPAEITGQPFTPSDQAEAAGHAAAPMLRAVLRDVELGEWETDTPVRPLDQLRGEVEQVNRACVASDYGTLGELVPRQIGELHEHLQSRSANGDVLPLLIQTLHSAFYLAKDLGHGDLGWMVASHLHRAAQQLGDPVWGSVAEFVRSHAVVGDRARHRGMQLAQRAAEIMRPDNADAGQAYGMLHLASALHAASLGRVGLARAHVDEAGDVAAHTGEGQFAGLMFGPTNVGVWRVALAVEFGEGERVDELAHEVDVRVLPSAGRQATFYGDVGRGLAQQRGQEERAVAALLHGEALASQRLRTNPYVRTTVTDLLPRTRGQAGQDLRGLAYRMGLAG